MSCDIKVFATSTDNLLGEVEYQFLDYVAAPVSIGGFSAISSLTSKAIKVFKEDPSNDILTWDIYLFSRDWLKDNSEGLEIVERLKPLLEQAKYAWIGIQPF